MSELFSYSPEAVNILVAGLLAVEGYVDGTFVSISKDILPFKSVRTADGIVSRLYSNDQTYTVTLTIHSGTNSNDFLTKLWQLDEITQRGKFPLLIKDSSGSDMFFSTTTWIEQIPPITKSNGVDARVWVMRSSQAVINIGGNQGASSILDDLLNIATSALPALEGIL